MKASYTRGSKFTPDTVFVASAEEAWQMAFSDIEKGNAWPLEIHDGSGNHYDRRKILDVYQASIRKKIETEKRESTPEPRKKIKNGTPRNIYDAIFNSLTETEQRDILKKAVARLPVYLRDYYQRESSRGKTLNDMPLLKTVALQERNEILKEMKDLIKLKFEGKTWHEKAK